MFKSVLVTICLMSCYINTIWAYSGGSGTQSDPYLVSSKADLIALGMNVGDYDKCFKMTSDIDLSGETFTTAVISPDTDTDMTFDGTSFTGLFDGNGFKITYLTIENQNYDTGLFGYIGEGGVVKNLGIENCDISGGDSYTGGLCGLNEGTIADCYATGTVSGSFSTGCLCGGNWGTISGCYATGTVDGSSYSTGGLCGLNGSVITNCYATGSVDGMEDTGGLCGENDALITNSYATGNVSGSGNKAGGLCGFNGSTIANCYATGTVTGYGNNSFGGLCGLNSDGTITNSYATGAVTGYGNYTGGLYGQGYNGGEIVNCYATGDVVSTGNYTGGLCGGNSSIAISNCYAIGDTSGADYTGGLCGENSYSGTITNCYSAGNVSGSGYTGGLCGYDNYGGEITNCFWDTQTSGQQASVGGEGKTTVEMKTQSTFTDAGWEFTPQGCWLMSESISIFEGYPALDSSSYSGGSGTQTDPYLITTKYDLIKLGSNTWDYGSYFKMTCDIDLTGEIFTSAVIAMDGDGDGEFSGTEFNGSFDGNGFKIISLTIESDYYYYSGLFGYIGDRGSVKNLGIESCNISGSEWAIGGLCAVNAGNITSCYVTGTITGYAATGGLCGINSGTISNCYATGSCSIGGLCGENSFNGTISDCYAACLITDPYSDGGFCSYNEGSITNCFWDTDVSGLEASSGGTGQTTVQMNSESTFISAGWDYVNEDTAGMLDVWFQNTGEYPKLYWQASRGDSDYDGNVDEDDLVIICGQWLSSSTETARLEGDADFDGTVNIVDVALMADNWLSLD